MSTVYVSVYPPQTYKTLTDACSQVGVHSGVKLCLGKPDGSEVTLVSFGLGAGMSLNNVATGLCSALKAKGVSNYVLALDHTAGDREVSWP